MLRLNLNRLVTQEIGPPDIPNSLSPQMQRQPDRQGDHQYRERIATPHYAGHLIGLALVLFTEQVIQYRLPGPPLPL